MYSSKVKICGITSLEDAQAAVSMGADLIGFNFYDKSPRYLTVEQASEIAGKLPGFVDLVGVFVNASVDTIRRAMEGCFLNWIQLHGDETPQFCHSFDRDMVKVIKALRIRDRSDLDHANDFHADAILLDAFDSDLYGGTGKKFDWDLITHIDKRIFLAGGINPDNAAEAMDLGLYAIDVCSSIELEPGKKDHVKMRKLFDNIKHI